MDPAAARHPDPGIDAVLFDYGRVLSLPQDAAAWERIRSLTSIPQDQLARSYWAHRDEYDAGTLTGVQYWHAIAREGGIPLAPALLAQLLEADVDLWGGINRPMLDWAFSLQRRGLRTGILSNIGDQMELGLRRRYAWIDTFACVWSHRLRVIKPHAAIYLHAVTALACPPARILFIDDREANVDGAAAAGMQALLYSSHSAFLHAMHQRGFESLLDAPAASL